jgi:hypothetical protein
MQTLDLLIILRLLCAALLACLSAWLLVYKIRLHSRASNLTDEAVDRRRVAEWETSSDWPAQNELEEESLKLLPVEPVHADQGEQDDLHGHDDDERVRSHRLAQQQIRNDRVRLAVEWDHQGPRHDVARHRQQAADVQELITMVEVYSVGCSRLLPLLRAEGNSSDRLSDYVKGLLEQAKREMMEEYGFLDGNRARH